MSWLSKLIDIGIALAPGGRRVAEAWRNRKKKRAVKTRPTKSDESLRGWRGKD